MTLLIGIPSKGRLQENVQAFFARAGLKLEQPRGGRDYRGHIRSVPGVEVAFLSASEIARELGAGNLHFGVTGEDLIRENLINAGEKVTLLEPLGFGHANVVVAVPEAWIDVRSMADLDDVATRLRARNQGRLRVATKYLNLTRQFFAAHHVADYRLVESAGATEGAPAAGAADVIVDITTSGATLSANALKVLDDGVMLRSEANLILSRTADWNAQARALAHDVLRRIAAERTSARMLELRLEPPMEHPSPELMARFKASSIRRRDESKTTSVLVMRENAAALSMALLADGAERIIARETQFIFEQSPALIARFEESIIPKSAN